VFDVRVLFALGSPGATAASSSAIRPIPAVNHRNRFKREHLNVERSVD
jgi:hypothetical protein